MSRTIKQSTDLLKSSLEDIKTSLTDKLAGGGDLNTLKVSEVSGYIDQIQSGGSGTEIDLSDYDVNTGWGILIIFSSINMENTLEHFYINNVKRDGSFYKLSEYNINKYNEYIFAVVLKDTDPETFTIKIDREYDGSSDSVYLRDINKPNKKIAVIKGQFGY